MTTDSTTSTASEGLRRLEADVVVVGVGSVGSMASWQLAARGLKVVGVDRFPVPGPFSAYAGESRIFRKVYAEGGHYTPVLTRAQELWRELEQATGTELLNVVGAATILDHDHPELEQLLKAGQGNGLEYEVLSGDDARGRLPGHLVRDGDVALFDPEGGYVRSERAVTAAIGLASRLGATFIGNNSATSVQRRGEKFVVRTENEEIIAAKVLVSPGTGAGPVCDALGTHVAVLPQILTWFPMARPAAYSAPGSSVFLRRSLDGDVRFYGFPSADGWTVKVAASIYLDEVPSMLKPLSWEPRHLDTARSWVAEFLPDLVPEPVRVAVCADGYTVDDTGLLGPVPGMDGVVVATGFSGHGFKMASALGAIAADFVADGGSATDVGFMDPARFLAPGATLESLPLS